MPDGVIAVFLATQAERTSQLANLGGKSMAWGDRNRTWNRPKKLICYQCRHVMDEMRASQGGGKVTSSGQVPFTGVWGPGREKRVHSTHLTVPYPSIVPRSMSGRIQSRLETRDSGRTRPLLYPATEPPHRIPHTTVDASSRHSSTLTPNCCHPSYNLPGHRRPALAPKRAQA